MRVLGACAAGDDLKRVGRTAWIGMLLAIVAVVVLMMAWANGGSQPLRWIEQPVQAPGEGG